MPASAARIVRQYLIQLGVLPNSASNAEWSSTIGGLQPDLSNAIAFVDTTPFQEGRLMTGQRVVHPRIQILIRSIDNPTGWNKGEAIQAAFDALGISAGGLSPVTIGSSLYGLKAVHVLVPMTPMGEEKDTRRTLFSINAQVELVELTPDNYKRMYGTSTPTVGDYVIGINESTGQWTLFLVGDIGGGGGGAGDPSALVGLAPVIGTASTFLRSDSAPALDLAIDPTWTGGHTFTGVLFSSGGLIVSGIIGLTGSVFATLPESDPGTQNQLWRNRDNVVMESNGPILYLPFAIRSITNNGLNQILVTFEGTPHRLPSIESSVLISGNSETGYNGVALVVVANAGSTITLAFQDGSGYIGDGLGGTLIGIYPHVAGYSSDATLDTSLWVLAEPADLTGSGSAGTATDGGGAGAFARKQITLPTAGNALSITIGIGAGSRITITDGVFSAYAENAFGAVAGLASNSSGDIVHSGGNGGANVGGGGTVGTIFGNGVAGNDGDGGTSTVPGAVDSSGGGLRTGGGYVSPSDGGPFGSGADHLGGGGGSGGGGTNGEATSAAAHIVHYRPFHSVLKIINNGNGTATVTVPPGGVVPAIDSWVLLWTAGVYQVLSVDSATTFTLTGSPSSVIGSFWEQEDGSD